MLLAFIILLIILFVFIISIYTNRCIEDNNMNGFWKGGASFCQEAELDILLLYLGKFPSFSSEVNGYILAKNTEGIIMNNPIKIKFQGGNSLIPKTCDCREYTININWIDDDGYDFFPNKQELFYYPNVGKLVFVADGETKAVLYKDYETTDISNKMPKQVQLEIGEEI